MRFAVFASVLFLAPIAPAQRIITVAGLGPSHRAEVDGRDALDAPLDQVYGLLLSPSSGRLLIHDEQLVERLEPDGTLLAVAGAINWRNGSTADGTPASALGLLALRGMAEDASGALYLADAAVGRIYRVRDGIATTFAAMPSPRGLVFDAQGNLIVAEASCRCIRRVTPDGHGSTVYALPDTQPVRYFEGVALDRSGNIYATEYAGDEVLKIAADGAATTIAGPKDVNGPSGVAVAPDGTVYIADTKNNRILRVAADGSISTVAGAEEGFDWPAQVISAPDGSLYVSEYRKRRVRRIDANGGITTIAGSGTLSRAASGDPGDGGPAIYANVSGASAALFDAAGNLLVAESFASRVRRIAPDQTITTLAAVPIPYGLATDPFGGLYIAGGDDRVRRVDPDGTISVFAGVGPGSGLDRAQGDGGPATAATLNEPKGVAVDAAGNVYIADTSNARLRVVDRNGIIRTVAGPGQLGSDYWNAIAFDPSGRLDLAITRLAPPNVTSVVDRVGNDGSLAQVAGSGTPLRAVVGITFDAGGNLYIPDEGSGTALRVGPDGVEQTVVSDPGLTAVAFDRSGNLFLIATDRIDQVTNAATVVQLSSPEAQFTGAGSQKVLVTTNFAMPSAYIVRIDGGTWLSVNRVAAVTGEPVIFTADPAGLGAGVYHATVTIRVGEQAVTLPVTLTVR